MEVSKIGELVAVVTTRAELVQAGNVSVFVAKDDEERDAIAQVLTRTTQAMVHALPNGVYFLVRHR